MTSHEIKTEVRISNATPAQVIDKLTDADSYARDGWSTFVRSMKVVSGGGADGEIVEGTVLENKLDVTGDGARLMEFKPVVLTRSVDELRWVGELAGAWLFRGEHYFKAAADGSDTVLEHGELFSGLLVLVFKIAGMADTEKAFVRFNGEVRGCFEG